QPVAARAPATPPTPAVAAPAAPVVLAPAPAVVVSPSKAEPKVARVAAKAAPPRPHGFLATKVSQPKPPAEPKEAPEPKAAKADPEPKTAKADAEAKKPAAKKDATTTDAMKILEAANKDTTNTL